MPSILAALLVLLLGLYADRTHAAPQEITGQVASGAWYRIAVPEGWQAGDAIVLYQHGFDLNPPEGPPDLGPLKDLALSEGYAVAASSFRTRGWALFHAIDDNRDLLEVFAQRFGAPGHMLPFGGSMGGLIALRLAEAEGFPPVPGVFTMCPAAAGARLWDTAIDLRLAYATVCQDAGELAHGQAPLWWTFDLDAIPDNLGDLSNLAGVIDNAVVIQTLAQVNRCTGINLPPSVRNQAMQRRLGQLMDFIHVSDEKFFLTNLGYSTFVLADLVRAPDKLAGRNPFMTAGVDYRDDAQIDAGIERMLADPGAWQALHAASDFGGRIGNAKVISLHTSRDQLVIPGNQDYISAVVPEAQRTLAIVAEDAPTHCGFNLAEGVAGWEALRAWMGGAPQPRVSDLQTLCTSLLAQAPDAGPCRFDPDAQVLPFDATVRPRAVAPLRPFGHSRHLQAPPSSGASRHLFPAGEGKSRPRLSADQDP
ncbi:hypothetical protein [Dokdonella sp.]|uniref:hypothetical protein n=1 Tax=Dokdonella sp. TaxID=2291710 RepID=UPI0025BA2067|nr:hypothetical protein [Dokdonella sp.]MBX3688679.1 hypothetical protein [Dokdonella sp.]